jgi:hypothetical protein
LQISIGIVAVVKGHTGVCEAKLVQVRH